ncbi:MAG: hypothetical protein ABJB47_01425 [Actinomycetota bacterium]
MPAYQPASAAQPDRELPSFLEEGPELNEFPFEPDLPGTERPRTHRYSGGHAFQRPGRWRRARAAAAAASESAEPTALPGESRRRDSDGASHARTIVDPSRRLADPRQAQLRSWTSTPVPRDDPGPASSEDFQDGAS